MAWLSDLTSALGLPVGAATLAGAMYAACAAAEKVARPEALSDIGRILRVSKPTDSVRPADVIGKLFVWTFGKRHLSWKCLVRSISASIITIFIITVITYSRATDPYISQVGIWLFVILFVGLIPDYISLFKTRSIIKTNMPVFLLLGTDIICSVIVSTLFFILFDSLLVICLYGISDIYAVASTVGEAMRYDANWFLDPKGLIIVPPILFVSTLFTSVWTVLIVLSTITLRVLAPIQHMTAWFFDVEKHPVQAIGIVAGSLTIMGSFAWSILWYLI